ncbi:hypothetical protein [Roseivirga echinicomitans]
MSLSSLQAQIYFEEKAEEADSVSFMDRVYFGGNFSFNIGTDFTYIDVSPLAGYMVTDDFSAGLGATYLYLSRKYILLPSRNTFKVSSSVYGGRTFLRHNIFENYFAHMEFEALNVEFAPNPYSEATNREWVPGLFIGGGAFQPIFGKGGINITVLYNLLHDDLRSPYGSALVIRGGITF